MNTILEHSLTAPAETLKNPQQANAKLAIIFEAVKLALAVDSESSHVQKAIMILKPFLSAKETNFRYIGLDVLTYFVSYPETRPYLQMDLQSVVQTLRDKDVSVQRRSLYLLFCLADSSNGEYIVRELMDFFNTANFEIHDELVLKIAILAEKFATDYGWFLQVILDLINIAGEHVGDEVWFRIVYIVTNNEDIRAFAAGRVLRSLWNPICNEKTLKLSGYILGEYGHLISNEPGASPLEQFMALHAKFRSASTPTRCLLLSVYLKLVNVFPEIKAEVMRVFKQYIHALDTELQQRACEYLAILEMDTDDVLQAVCEEMPPFAERANILVSQLEHKYQEVSHKRALDFLDQGKKEPNAEKNLQASGSPQDYAIPRKQSVNLLSFEDDANSQDDSAAIHTAVLYKKLILENTGVFYEDSAIQIGLKMEFRNTSGKLAIFVGNKTDSSLVNVSCVVISSESYQFKLVEQLAPVVPSMTQLHQLTDIECLTVALETPILHFGFQKAGAVLKKLELSLPIHMARFMVPVELSRSNFDDRWQQIGGPPRECQIQMRTDNLVSSDSLKKMMKQLNMQVLEDVEDTCWAAGIFCSSTLGKVGCLVRIDRMEMVQVF